MALKNDILKAFEISQTHTKVNQEGEIETIKPPTGRGTPLDTLAIDLTTAIAKYIKNLSFKVEDLKAEGMIMPGQVLTPGGPNTNPIPVKVQVSKLKNEVGLPQTLANAKSSLAKVDKDENRKHSGVNV
jgi:hypothetical protein